MIKQIIEKNEKISVNTKEIEFIKEKFPSCFDINGNFDIEKFKEILKDKINITNEGYELKFLGKNYARLLASLDTTTVIESDITHNEKDENKNSENIYISGDNLDGLKHLLNSYSQKIKVIYIDPPYNTGSDGFIYNDNYNFNVNDLMEKLNISEDEANKILKFTKKGTASHSAWLTFMYPRLLLARDLLSDNGVIFISIDDNEQANLKLMCDEIFGEENLIAVLPCVMNLKGNNDEFGFAGTHEYILVYGRNQELTKLFEYDLNDEDIEEWQEDEIGYYKKGANLKATGINAPKEKRPNLYFPIYIDEANKSFSLERRSVNDIELLPITDGVPMSWRWSKLKFIKQKEDVIININGSDISLYKKQRPEIGELPSAKPKTLFYKPEYSSGNGTTQLKELFDKKKVFSNPKPIDLISDLIKIGNDEDGYVLDFFSGSGTSAVATMYTKIESEKLKNIKFITIQIPENLDENLLNATIGNKDIITNAIELCDKCNYPHTLDYIGIERLKRVAKKIKEDNPNKELDLGFKHFVLKEVNEDTFDKIEEFVIDDTRLTSISNLIDDFGKDVVLTTWLNKDGYGLTNKNKLMYETIKFADYEAYYRDKHLYIINKNLLDDAIKAMVEKYELDGSFNPENIVIFGYSLGYIEMENLKNNLVRVKDSAKNLNINFDIRY